MHVLVVIIITIELADAEFFRPCLYELLGFLEFR